MMTLLLVLAVLAAVAAAVTAVTIAGGEGLATRSSAEGDRARPGRDRRRAVRRKVRFEETFDLTVPDDPGFASPVEARTPTYLLDEEDERIPLTTRVLGALRLILVIVLSAAAVAGAIWAAGYFLTGQIGL